MSLQHSCFEATGYVPLISITSHTLCYIPNTLSDFFIICTKTKGDNNQDGD